MSRTFVFLLLQVGFSASVAAAASTTPTPSRPNRVAKFCAALLWRERVPPTHAPEYEARAPRATSATESIVLRYLSRSPHVRWDWSGRGGRMLRVTFVTNPRTPLDAAAAIGQLLALADDLTHGVRPGLTALGLNEKSRPDIRVTVLMPERVTFAFPTFRQWLDHADRLAIEATGAEYLNIELHARRADLASLRRVIRHLIAAYR